MDKIIFFNVKWKIGSFKIESVQMLLLTCHNFKEYLLIGENVGHS